MLEAGLTESLEIGVAKKKLGHYQLGLNLSLHIQTHTLHVFH